MCAVDVVLQISVPSCEIWDSHDSNCGEYHLLECSTAQSWQESTNVLEEQAASIFRAEGEGGIFFQNISQLLLDYSVPFQEAVFFNLVSARIIILIQSYENAISLVFIHTELNVIHEECTICTLNILMCISIINNDQFKEDGVGGVCSLNGGEEEHV
jgi:hypothetical protein